MVWCVVDLCWVKNPPTHPCFILKKNRKERASEKRKIKLRNTNKVAILYLVHGEFVSGQVITLICIFCLESTICGTPKELWWFSHSLSFSNECASSLRYFDIRVQEGLNFTSHWTLLQQHHKVHNETEKTLSEQFPKMTSRDQEFMTYQSECCHNSCKRKFVLQT